MTVQQTRDLQRFMAERALRWIIARPGSAGWVSSVRPRTIDAEAYANEQEAWKRWARGPYRIRDGIPFGREAAEGVSARGRWLSSVPHQLSVSVSVSTAVLTAGLKA